MAQFQGVPGASQDAFNSLSNQIATDKSDMEKLSYGGAVDTVTVSVRNGTSTSIDNGLNVSHSDKYIFIKGYVRIRGFSRTGTNPGIEVTLPSGVTTASSRSATGIGSTLNPSEFLTLSMSANTNKFSVTTSENLANATSGTWIMLFPPMMIKR